MLLGLDVGGTHTDAVLLDDNGIVSVQKEITNHEDLLSSVLNALQKVLKDVDVKKIRRINLSTTLSTNAIIENRISPVAVIVSAGPGINPSEYSIGDYFYNISGSIDHRGEVIKELDKSELKKILDDLKKQDINSYAIVTKFSVRNSSHEKFIAETISPFAKNKTLGHELSGQLSFPRRINSAYYNSAVWKTYNSFIDSVQKSINKLGLNCDINILKADGGTMPLKLSKQIPVESILSGPAASIMGIIALCDISKDSIILDIGGTTTDIAIFASGSPLVERFGIKIASNPTLVRAMETKSIGIGGDSAIDIKGKHVVVGPRRVGPSVAHGGTHPTLIDALNFLKIFNLGNVKKSIIQLKKFANNHSLKADYVANSAVKFAIKKIKKSTLDFLDELNSKPVYTIHEMLDNKKISPSIIYAMGGPADGLATILQKEFKLDVIIPDNYQVANAIGAALSKTTLDMQLFADTTKEKLFISGLNLEKNISSSYTKLDAERDIKKYFIQYMNDLSIKISIEDVDIVESTEFNMVSGYSMSGKDIRIKAQLKPGIEREIF